MFLESFHKAPAGILINGSKLIEMLSLCFIYKAYGGNKFYINLNTLTGIKHLLVRLGFVCFLLLGGRKQPQFTQKAEQALRAAGVAALPQPVPQLHHAQVGVAAAHVPDQLQLRLCVLIGMAMGPPGLAG